jgi:hypothetical protein
MAARPGVEQWFEAGQFTPTRLASSHQMHPSYTAAPDFRVRRCDRRANASALRYSDVAGTD